MSDSLRKLADEMSQAASNAINELWEKKQVIARLEKELAEKIAANSTLCHRLQQLESALYERNESTVTEYSITTRLRDGTLFYAPVVRRQRLGNIVNIEVANLPLAPPRHCRLCDAIREELKK